MISRLNHVNVFVLDQERAKTFYTETLGFELRNDATLDGFRWLTVGPKDQKDLNILLAYPAPPMFSAEDAETVKTLVAKGALGGGVFETPDCQKTFEELSARGVTFLQEPAERPYGIEALFRDDSGNWFSLTQPKWLGGSRPAEASYAAGVPPPATRAERLFRGLLTLQLPGGIVRQGSCT